MKTSTLVGAKNVIKLTSFIAESIIGLSFARSCFVPFCSILVPSNNNVETHGGPNNPETNSRP